MKFCHNISLRYITKNDSYESVLGALDFLFPFDLIKNKIDIKVQTLTENEFNYDPLTVYNIFIDKQKLIGEFLRYFLRMLSPVQKKSIIKRASFLDEDYNIYIRLDSSALFNKEIKIVDHGDCFHLKLNLALYPRTREKAIELSRALFLN